MRGPSAIRWSIVLVVSTTTASALAMNETYSDDDFGDADWFVVELLDETLDNSAAFVGVQQPTGGNPDAHRAVSNAWSHDGTGSVSVTAAHVHAFFEHRPVALGEVGTVEYLFDVRTTGTTYPGLPGEDASVLFFPLLIQNGAYYAPATWAVGGEPWGSYVSGQLRAEDFARYAGDPLAPSTPDFTSTATPLSFGFGTATGPHALSGDYTIEGGLDNWSVFVRDPGEESDAGTGGSGGEGGSSSSGNGTVPPGVLPGFAPGRESDGCGCRLVPTGPSPRRLGWLLALNGALALTTRRRRRSRTRNARGDR